MLNGYVQRDRLLKTPETVIKPSRWGNNAGTGTVMQGDVSRPAILSYTHTAHDLAALTTFHCLP
jgi:hypothetical protein